MAHALVKRMDSAHMQRMYDNALETSDADFLCSPSDVTTDHVRTLKLGNESKEKTIPKPQNRPPQPPKHKTQPTFSLNSFDFLLEDGDAESWLVATPYDEAKRSQLKSAPVCEEKREVVSSPVDSNVSSEISRSSCVTPASVLDTKSLYKLKDESSNRITVARPKSVEPGQRRMLDTENKQKDIRNLPRSIGCINHTPAPLLDSKPEASKAAVKAKPKRAVLNLNAKDAEKAAPVKSLGSKLRGRISSITQKESKKPTSSIPKARPKSVGPVRRDRLPMSSPIPRPKSSLGHEKEDATGDRKLRSKKLASTPQRRPRSSATRPVSSLGTVKEEGNEGKRILGFRKSTSSPEPFARLKPSLGRSVKNKAGTMPSKLSQLAPSAPALQPSIAAKPVSDNKSIMKSAKPSRIASPSPRTLALEKDRAENKDSKGLLGMKKKSSSSLPPPSQFSTRLHKVNQETSRIRQKVVTTKKRA